jgi:pimeloyl-ACP methyl ester carboxylesterase
MRIMVDGAEVFAATGGTARDPTLPDMVLLHGAGMDHTVWQNQARYLAHHGRNIFALDLPGHGRSCGQPLQSIADLAAWLLHTLDAIGSARATLVGHSMGALVALAAAAQAPERARGLGLLGAAASMAVHPALRSAAEAKTARAHDLLVAWGYGRHAQLGGAATPGMWMLGGGSSLLAADTRGALAADLAACATYATGPHDASRVSCPSLIVVGDGDRMTPPKLGWALAAAIPGARHVVLPRCGHMMTIERPDLVLDALSSLP